MRWRMVVQRSTGEAQGPVTRAGIARSVYPVWLKKAERGRPRD